MLLSGNISGEIETGRGPQMDEEISVREGKLPSFMGIGTMPPSENNLVHLLRLKGIEITG